jgi:hypothetical protein
MKRKFSPMWNTKKRKKRATATDVVLGEDAPGSCRRRFTVKIKKY